MQKVFTYLIILIVSYCSIVYELLLAQSITNVLGNSVLRYSTTIGLYLFSLGIGSILCNIKTKERLLDKLIYIELLLSIVGSICVISIYFSDNLSKFLFINFDEFNNAGWIASVLNVSLADLLFFIFSSSIIFIVGFLSGFELPLLIEISKNESSGSPNTILATSYIGALVGSILFPTILKPELDVFSISFQTAILNIIACMIIFVKSKQVYFIRYFTIFLLLFIIGAGYLFSDSIHQSFLRRYYHYYDIRTFSELFSSFSINKYFSSKDYNIEHYSSPYQDIDLVRSTDEEIIRSFYSCYSKKIFSPDNNNPDELNMPDDLWLFLNGKYQFCSLAEEVYHEYFVHIPIMLMNIPQNVLILGGGDGLVVRELLKYKDIQSITLVELDQKVINLAKSNKLLLKMNLDSLSDKRVNIIIGDAFTFLKLNKHKYDAIYLDFPNPDDYNLSILYSVEFYTLVSKSMTSNGFAVFDAPGCNFNSVGKELSIYLSTLNAAKFQQIVPFYTALEKDNPLIEDIVYKVAEKIVEEQKYSVSNNEEDFESILHRLYKQCLNEIRNIEQEFIFITNSSIPVNKSFYNLNIPLNVLNEKRFYLSINKQMKFKIDNKLVNSIFKPTLPFFTLFEHNFPY